MTFALPDARVTKGGCLHACDCLEIDDIPPGFYLLYVGETGGALAYVQHVPTWETLPQFCVKQGCMTSEVKFV